MKVVMLTEGAKPGTPRIEPKKIYPDGLDLRIEVNITFKQLWRQEPKQTFYFSTLFIETLNISNVQNILCGS